ncbi:hypothetical protein [Spiroplasma endosymbiont of Polydrusus pterygomalis]|uniref:hypothetical protein n=1 Tax=Spiroplasma endosymbiont of Polydrusus pterygomalis TaxID=3139327 RepID=UPI003CCAA13C
MKIDLQYLFFAENYNFGSNRYIAQFLTQVSETNLRQINKITKLLLSKTIKIIENIVFMENSSQEVIFLIELIIFYCYYLKFKYPNYFEKVIQLTDDRLLNSNYMLLIKSEIISKYYDIKSLEPSSLKKLALNVNINPSTIPKNISSPFINKVIFGINHNKTFDIKLYSLLLPFFGYFVSKKEPNIFFRANSKNYEHEPTEYALDLKNQALEKHASTFFEIFFTIYDKNKNEISKTLDDKKINEIIKNSIFDY